MADKCNKNLKSLLNKWEVLLSLAKILYPVFFNFSRYESFIILKKYTKYYKHWELNISQLIKKLTKSKVDQFVFKYSKIIL